MTPRPTARLAGGVLAGGDLLRGHWHGCDRTRFRGPPRGHPLAQGPLHGRAHALRVLCARGLRLAAGERERALGARYRAGTAPVLLGHPDRSRQGCGSLPRDADPQELFLGPKKYLLIVLFC